MPIGALPTPEPGAVERWAPPPGWGDRLIKDGFGAVEWIDTTGSTNADLLSIPHQGQPRAAALRWAGYQHAGRGRRGRRWVGRAGDALTFSIAIERLIDGPADKPSKGVGPAAFSLVAGLMVAQSIESSPLTASRPGLKWPNDVLIDGAKVAGILVEVSQCRPVQRVVVGCGLNLRTPDPEQLMDGPASIIEPVGLLDADTAQGPHPCSPDEAAALVTEIAIRIRAAHELFFEAGLAPFADAWLARHAFHNQAIRLSDADKVLAEGRCVGIAPDGAILIDLPEGQQAFALGELSARPVSAFTNNESAQ